MGSTPIWQLGPDGRWRVWAETDSYDQPPVTPPRNGAEPEDLLSLFKRTGSLSLTDGAPRTPTTVRHTDVDDGHVRKPQA